MLATKETLSDYNHLSEDELNNRIFEVKKQLGTKAVILGHHYQKDDVIAYADYKGDSLKLAQLAADVKKAEYIVFCGVHFMAETADILTGPNQKVILPETSAGCPMADMADIKDVQACWDMLKSKYKEEIVPVTYVNSSAEIKAFCGKNNGMTCTSGNAEKVFKAILDQNKTILFLPDEHLGRNTASHYGISSEEMILWNPDQPELPEKAPRLILWNGYCSVHQSFTPEQIDTLKLNYPDINVIVHPECSQSVVQKADFYGSTELIIKMIAASPPGSRWSVGTEENLVMRLAKENPDKDVICLSEAQCLCTTMNRISKKNLLWVLENLSQDIVVNQISVDSETAQDAEKALKRMLEI